MEDAKVSWFGVILMIALSQPVNVVIVDSREEIDHPLDFKAATECRHEQNGQFHAGSQIRQYIKKNHRCFSRANGLALFVFCRSVVVLEYDLRRLSQLEKSGETICF